MHLCFFKYLYGLVLVLEKTCLKSFLVSLLNGVSLKEEIERILNVILDGSSEFCKSHSFSQH